MTEWAFVRASIKLIGLVFVILGLTFGTLNLVSGALQVRQGNRLLLDASAGRDSLGSRASIGMSMQRSGVGVLARLPGNLLQLGIGWYLIRRYHRLTRWLLRDVATASDPGPS